MSYRKGENLSCCPVCGKQYYAGDFRLRWDGLFVCRYDYEERHPQDFVRGKADNMQPAVVAGCCGAEGPESAPLCPFPLEPLDNAIIGNTTSVNLSFSTFAGISSYQIYFWEFGESQPATPTYTTTTSPYFVTGLEDNTGYFWFVTAVNEAGEIRDCSGNTRFFTTALAVPVCPTLVSPADMAEIEADSVVLDWDAVDGADGYLVYFNNVTEPRTLVTDTALTSFEVSGLSMGNTYYWQVIAYNDAGESSGCDSRTFSYPLPESIITTYSTPGEFEWEINPFTTSVEVRVLGGGGGGGAGCNSEIAILPDAGAGGGGACGAVQSFLISEITSTVTVTVGAGGTGGASINGSLGNNGTDGEPSSFGAYLVVGGGGGGARGNRGTGRSVGGGGGGIPSTGGTGGLNAGGLGGSVGGGDGGGQAPGALAGNAPSTDFGGGGGAAGTPDISGGASTIFNYSGAASLWGGSGGGSGGSSQGDFSSVGANGTPSTGAVDVPQGGAVTQVGPIIGNGEDGEDPVDPLLLAGSSGAGGGGSPSATVAFNTAVGGNGGVGGRGSGGGGGGSTFSSLGQGGNGGNGGNGYVVIIETFD